MRFQFFSEFVELDLWVFICSILDNAPCADEKNIYSTGIGWNVLQLSARLIQSIVRLNFDIFLSKLFLVFGLSDLSMDKSGALKAPSGVYFSLHS